MKDVLETQNDSHRAHSEASSCHTWMDGFFPTDR
jgi:hypothetical protein